MQFAQVIEQEALKEKLRGLSDHNRISHALLFVAREGTGGLPLALAFAQYLVCEKVNHKQDSNKPSLFGPTPQTHQTVQTTQTLKLPKLKIPPNGGIFFVASPRIELGSGASETLILSIVLQSLFTNVIELFEKLF